MKTFTKSHEPQCAHTKMSNNRNTTRQSGACAIVKKIFKFFPMKKIFYLLMALMISQNVFSQTCTPLSASPGNVNVNWTGAVSTDWNTACNWNPAWVPDATNNQVYIDLQTNQPTITGTVPTINVLNINNGVTLTVASSGVLTVNKAGANQIFFSGIGASIINNGTINTGTGNGVGFYINGSSSITNRGTINTNNTFGIAVPGSLTFTNESTGIVNSDFKTIVSVPTTITNHGAINYSGGTFAFSLNSGTSLINDGTITITGGSGISNPSGSTITNNACSKILMTAGSYENGGTTTNAGLIQTTNNLSNTGSFTNIGVLKYGSLTGTITNNQNSSIIVNNTPTPIFTYGTASYNGTINGIYKEQAATNLAGTFTAPNTFVPSGLAFGSQTLYAKITPSGGACEYIVPFTYNNTICSQIATATDNMTWTGAASTDWNNPCNWSPNGVPTATNAVEIPNVTNAPVISGAAVASNMRIAGSGASLTVNSGATLTSNSTTSVLSMSNFAQLTNRGTINLTNTNPIFQSTVALEMGLNTTMHNYGALNLTSLQNIGLEVGKDSPVRNYSGGIISINARHGIRGEGPITNDLGATITITGSEAGILYNGIFNNSGVIDITGQIQLNSPT
jgi:hypothetical protein